MSSLKTNKISKNTGSAVIIGDGGSDTLSVNSTPTFIKSTTFSSDATFSSNIIGNTIKGVGANTVNYTTPLTVGGETLGGKRNLIINGAMQVNQRAATSGVTSGYFVDRFRLSGCSASAVITSNTPTQFPTAITVSATSGNPIVSQRIESKYITHLSGKTVTASFYAKNVSNATTLYCSLSYAGSTDNFGSSTTITEHNLGSLTGDWVRYTASWTVPAAGLTGIALNILCAGSSTFTMGVAGVQLEVGTVATEFEHRSFADELPLCQRYYLKTNPEDDTRTSGMAGVMYTTTQAVMTMLFPVEMHKAPTVTIGGSNNSYWIAGVNGTASGTVVSTQYKKNMAWWELGSVSTCPSNGYQITYSGQISFDSEI